MFVSRLALDDFRSWRHCVVDFQPGINVLVGANGLGKTNIVEAIEVLSTGNSHRVNSSVPLVRAGQKQATIRLNVAKDQEENATTYEVTIPVRGANRVRINSGKSMYMRDVVGKVRSVTFSPEDQQLVSAEPSIRRRFLDQAGTQLIVDYYETLSRFNQIAKQRAALLKQLSQQQAVAGTDASAALSGLEIWTSQFIDAGVALTEQRAQIVQRISEPFARIYRSLAGDDQQVAIRYTPSFAEALTPVNDLADEHEVAGADSANSMNQANEIRLQISRHFQRIYPGEVAQARNLIGPHRDDLTILLNGLPAREYASNGEMWTLALALKMALFETLSETDGQSPILILDDVFAQLDESRRRQIVEFCANRDQVLITMAAYSDLPQDAATKARLIEVSELIRQQQQDDPAAMLASFGFTGGKPQ